MFARHITQLRLVRFTALVLCLAAPNIALARTPVKFDEFGRLSCTDELARLDNYGKELSTFPDALAVIVVYGARSGTIRGEVVARLFAIRDALVRRTSIDTKRIVILDGGFRDEFSIELWIIPSYGRDSVRFLITSEIPPATVRLRGPALSGWQYKCELQRKKRRGVPVGIGVSASSWEPEEGSAFFRYTRKLPQIAKVELFRIREEQGQIQIVASKTLLDNDAAKFAQLWRTLKRGSGAGCFVPAYRIKFYTSEGLLLDTEVCFGCDNLTLPGGTTTERWGFDGGGPRGQALLAALKSLL